MKVIGLTGSIGSGKSTVANMLKDAGIAIIDADILARAVANSHPVLAQIKKRFGSQVFRADKTLDRQALGLIVFANPQALADLEKITHPAIENLFYEELEKLKKAGNKIAVYVVPLLFEKKLNSRVDKTLLVIAHEKAMLNRIQKRDGLSEHEAKMRLAAQMSTEEKIRQADEIIENNGTLDELSSQLKLVWLRLCNMDLTKA